MMRNSLIRPGVTAAVLAVCLCQSLRGAQPPGDKTQHVVDVSLNQDGLLVGQVVNPQGGCLGGERVYVHGKDHLVATTETDREGYFRVDGLGGGIYQVLTAGASRTYRIWRPGMAPPMSQRAVLVVAAEETVRGNGCFPCFGALRFWLSDPCFTAGLVGAGVAIPVIIHNTQRPPASP